jgi:NADH dehydrogenase [ubiquinone] 1 alpha subcomplex assembly factor 7
VSDLKSRIARLIAAEGPISVAQYMTLALHDPAGGYYAARDPFGARGDFITAPEVSQMFGELIGLWLVQCWREQGAPSPARLVELGPGRGTLMADVLRATRAVPEFLDAIEIVLVEASTPLRNIQREKLSSFVHPPHPGPLPEGGRGSELNSPLPLRGRGLGEGVRWLGHFDSEILADRPLFLIANEFFDALPIRQYVKTERGWCERMVMEKNGELAFALSPTPSLGLDVGAAEDGAVYETSPASIALAEEISRTISARGGAALIVDYGHDGGFGDTLQAVANHKYAGVLDAPGDADLSTHVDFAALAAAAKRGGTSAFGPVGQGAFLNALGLGARARQLIHNNPHETKSIEAAVDRLTVQMGTLFKALVIVPDGTARPAGF